VANTAQSVMAHLSIAEIKALDDRIDSGIAVFATLSLPKPVMAIHLLRFYEDYLRRMRRNWPVETSRII
jgi:hypothetical protein